MQLTFDNNVNFRISHIDGVNNVVADLLSREKAPIDPEQATPELVKLFPTVERRMTTHVPLPIPLW